MGHKNSQRGPLLVTHWGMSGPGIIKLSAWHASKLYDAKYQFQVQVNWLGDQEDASFFKYQNVIRMLKSYLTISLTM